MITWSKSSPQVGIAIGGFYLKYAITQFQDGNIEGTATQVINRNGRIVVFLSRP